MVATKPPEDVKKPSRILIVDDHPVLRLGLTALIESVKDLIVCGQAANTHDAVAEIERTAPDLVVVDLALEGSDGLDLLKEMKARCPGIPALVLSMYPEAVYAERSFRAGARGYVSKQQLDDTVLIAIREILEGGTYMSDKLKERLASKFVNGDPLDSRSPLETLSDRELQVFRYIGQARSTRQIAESLNLSFKTIESHREHIKQKLGLSTAAELSQRAALWVATGQADPPIEES